MRRTGFSIPGAGWACIACLFGSTVVISAATPVRAQEKKASATDRTPEQLFSDFLFYGRVGRYTVAEKMADALINHPDLDPVALLEVADNDRESIDTLQIIMKHDRIGEKAAQVMELLNRGEYESRKRPERIRKNIELLGGTPQQKFVGMRNLAQSGEFAVPALVAVLTDNDRRELHLPVRDALVQIGKAAVAPLSIALGMEDSAARLLVIDALGNLGYHHAAPYLRRIAGDAGMTSETRSAAEAAIARIAQISGRPVTGSADELFVTLADRYYGDDATVRADPRVPEANVWYWDDDAEVLVASVVPTEIHGPVMAMECAQDALAVRSDNADAISLWLAANIRREARLGLDVESGAPVADATADVTRPDAWPRAIYFTQAAGAEYAHRVLARAVSDADASVALGAIEALRVTAGEASLIGRRGAGMSLARALEFPDVVVRTRAALALGAALPRSPFADSHNVVPLLANALNMTGEENILVIDPDENNLNRVLEELRRDGRKVIGETNVYKGLGRARAELHSLTGMFVASDVNNPGIDIGIRQMRSEATFAKTPVVLLSKPQQRATAEDIANADAYVEEVSAFADAAALDDALDRVRRRTGQSQLDGDLASEMALQAAETLKAIAGDGRTVLDFSEAEAALKKALAAGPEQLQIVASEVLAYAGTATAQAALLNTGLDDGRSDTLRVSALKALARSAKMNGNQLTSSLQSNLVGLAKDEGDLVIRTAASQALGALNLPASPASEIIRSYHQQKS